MSGLIFIRAGCRRRMEKRSEHTQPWNEFRWKNQLCSPTSLRGTGDDGSSAVAVLATYLPVSPLLRHASSLYSHLALRSFPSDLSQRSWKPWRGREQNRTYPRQPYSPVDEKVSIWIVEYEKSIGNPSSEPSDGTGDWNRTNTIAILPSLIVCFGRCSV